MDRSSHGVFVLKNQIKSELPPSTTRARDRFTPAIFPLSPELPTPSLSSYPCRLYLHIWRDLVAAPGINFFKF
jgi:hypothetical protein